jgi:NitT/TauT family transport system substrate-binding protein
VTSGPGQNRAWSTGADTGVRGVRVLLKVLVGRRAVAPKGGPRCCPAVMALLVGALTGILLAATLIPTGCGGGSPAAALRVPKLTLVAPPGPLAIPMAYLAANNKLSAVADTTEVVVWENQQQLQAMVAGKQGDFVTMPSNNSAIFYNKGVPLKLLDISVWNITYLVSTDANVKGFKDIKGRSIAIPFEGSVPDLMAQLIAQKEGLDLPKDLQVRYATDPTQAAQLLLTGQVQNAVLSEPMPTAALLQAQTAGKKLYRALSFDIAWQRATGTSARTPIAGTVATASVLDKPAVIAEFSKQYKAALAWMIEHPEEAGSLIETTFPKLGLKAGPMTASLKNITWNYTSGMDAKQDVDGFLKSLSGLSPEVIGGKLPDAGFYYAP